MKTTSEPIKKFFEEYEKASDTLDLEVLAASYADSFMFANHQGAQTVKMEDFLRVLPKRKGFFKAVGMSSLTIKALEETRLDKDYVMVRVFWTFRIEKEGAKPVLDEISATYILFQQGSALRIVFQLDHQDLTKRLQDLGLYPAAD